MWFTAFYHNHRTPLIPRTPGGASLSLPLLIPVGREAPRGFRFITNLSMLNKYVITTKFKMVRTVMSTIRQDDWMVDHNFRWSSIQGASTFPASASLLSLTFLLD
ncbi:hypothetical protein E2C01_033015 [Portunus trituberculatus]|uniref:Uncharacterized protein n=1 Tax=Portunus trituberculatus TaxID=210409 RepID=A0A5B7F2U0_PORTR|nr:hypothetical protein [Portunus trituberculatus]